ncbi:hypothetical protein Hypma_014906 [Hypsizygus marmoreus]|uniref:CHAT domain-containing protein n=1 Tax=Hypsizygus marmoreus TaxID=39966 RepID=A0A369KA78_HYPMA|nr:hypothetical protein Hypma_014906 [Hypsizygus marmoreus]
MSAQQQLRELSKKIEHYTYLAQHTPDSNPQALDHYIEIGHLHRDRFKLTNDPADLNDSITGFTKSVLLAPRNAEFYPYLLRDLGTTLVIRWKLREQSTDIEKAVAALQEAVQRLPEGDEDAVAFLNNLANALVYRFEVKDDLSDLDEAITVQRKVNSLFPATHPQLPFLLGNLGESLRRRFERTGLVGDINEAVAILDRAGKLSGDRYPQILDSAGLALVSRSGSNRGPDALADLKEAIRKQKKALELLGTDQNHPSRAQYLSNLGASFLRLFEENGDGRALGKAVEMLREAVLRTPANHPQLRSQLGNLASAVMKQFELSGDVEDINEAVSLHERCIRLTPDNHPDLASFLRNLGLALSQRFAKMEELKDIDTAVSSLQKSISLTPSDHPNRSLRLMNLGNAYRARFKLTRSDEDLQQSVSACKAAIALLPETHADLPSHLGDLGASLLLQFIQSGKAADADAAISTLRKSISLTSARDRKSMHDGLIRLGSALEHRFGTFNDPKDIEEAIDSIKKASTFSNKTEDPGDISVLCDALQKRYEHSGDVKAINDVIQLRRKAVKLTPRDDIERPDRTANLGLSVVARYSSTKAIADIEEGVSLLRKAISMAPQGHKSRPWILDRLAYTLGVKYQHSRKPQDLTDGVSFSTAALSLVSNSNPLRSRLLRTLGDLLVFRYDYSGDLRDIDQAISMHKEAFEVPRVTRATTEMLYSGLGRSLLARYNVTHDSRDLFEAALAQLNALNSLPDGHALRPTYLTDLGNTFHVLFEQSGNSENLDEAVSLYCRAVQIAQTQKDDPGKPLFLSNLGNSFQDIAAHQDKRIFIHIAVATHRGAVEMLTDDDPSMPALLANLANSLVKRFELYGNDADIDEAIATFRRAVDLTPAGDISRVTRLHDLGITLLLRFDKLAKHKDLEAGILNLRLAATDSNGSPYVKMHAARHWGARYVSSDPAQSLIAFGIAVDLIPRVVWIGEPITQRHVQLADIAELALEAAAAAISAQKYELALTWLEQGRSVVWNQLHHLRTPVDTLKEKEPKLADDLLRISSVLEAHSSRPASTMDAVTTALQQFTLDERRVQQHHRAAEEWEELLTKIRRLPGFEDFLQAMSFSHMKESAPQEGPVVVLNVHKSRCDALVLNRASPSVRHIALPKFSYSKAQNLWKALKTYLGDCKLEARSVRHGRPASAHSAGLRDILAELWKCIVKPVLDSLEYKPSSANPPRIWWCATGPLAFLPLHAAGIYGPMRRPGSALSDFAISSYTPTVRAVLSDNSRDTRKGFNGIVAIAMPNTPEQEPLPFTVNEIQQIDAQFSARRLNAVLLEGDQATPEKVLEGMRASGWVHLACHAGQDINHPTKSAFLLGDGQLELATLIQNPLPHADFAFLSACQTAMGTESLSEEAVHLAAGMLTAGYRGLIATMWSINDEDAPFITKEVYSSLLGTGKPVPDSSDAASALHKATKHLSESLGDSEDALLRWLPFVHFGL